MSKIPDEEKLRKSKYENHAQLVQAVCQVAEPTLTQGEQCFLNCLAAHWTHANDLPHPGNARLAIACRVSTRQGVNKIAKRLIKRRLIEIVGNATGGRGKAATYRIRIEDSRFPEHKKPATVELHVSQNNKPATNELHVSEETRNSDSLNPQLSTAKPATPELHPNLDSEFKNELKPTRYARSFSSNLNPTTEEHIARDLRNAIASGLYDEHQKKRLLLDLLASAEHSLKNPLPRNERERIEKKRDEIKRQLQDSMHTRA